jgi:peptidylprolyl isomerase/FKBP-type peptidyl-prolyl cis-trans isomerase FkpA
MNKNFWTGAGVVVVIAIGLLYWSARGTSTDNSAVNTNQTTGGDVNNNTNTNNMNVTELKMEDEVVGTGEVATAGSKVTVDYVGMLTNGTVFDASKSHGSTGFTFTLGSGQVIKGWDMGVAGMKVGGKRKLTIPASLAYGNQSVGGGLIPANSTLIFEVELRAVNK